MTDNDYKDLVTNHDKSIGIMAASIEHLVSAVGATNTKLSDIIEVIGKQNILMEKFTNLESNLKESFGRVHIRSNKLESDVNEIKEETRKLPSPAALKWVIGLIVLYSVSFGTFVVTEIHDLDTRLSTLSVEANIIHRAYDVRIDTNTNNSNRNFEKLQGYFKMQGGSDVHPTSSPKR